MNSGDISNPHRAMGLILALATCVSASSLTVVTSNIPPEADKIAIIVDGGSINGSVSAYQDVKLGTQSTSTFVFSNLPAGPFRARVLAFNTETGKPLRTGRALSTPADGTATVVLGDVYEPYATTPVTRAAHASKQVVSFRIADPGGWLDATQPEVYSNPGRSVRAAPLKNLSSSGSWDVSATLQMPISGNFISYAVSVQFPLPPGNTLQTLYLSGGGSYFVLTSASQVTLNLSGVPTGATNAWVLVDRGGISGTLASVQPVSQDSLGKVSVTIGLSPGGPYRVRVGVATPAPLPTRPDTLAASAQLMVTALASGSVSANLALQPVSLTMDPGNPVAVPSGRTAYLAFNVTDAGALLEGAPTWVSVSASPTDQGSSSGFGHARFQKIATNTWRASILVAASSATPYVRPGFSLHPDLAGQVLYLAPTPVTLTTAGTPSSCSTGYLPYLSVSATGGSGALSAPYAPGCAWTVYSTAPWLRVYPPSGVGPTPVTYSVSPNFRDGSVTGSVIFGDRYALLFAEGSPDPEDTRFIKLLYYNFLGRYPTAAEIAGQTSALAAGATRADLANTFASSAEFQLAGKYIAGLYFGIIGRDAEVAGWLFQRNALINGIVTPTSLVDNFLNAPEFKLKYGTLDDAAFVRLLYRNILLREAQSNEVTGQVAALVNRVVTRSSMTAAFLNSPEFGRLAGPRLTAFVMYAALLNRDATSYELGEAASAIEGGTTQRTLIDWFVNSREFQSQLVY